MDAALKHDLKIMAVAALASAAVATAVVISIVLYIANQIGDIASSLFSLATNR